MTSTDTAASAMTCTKAARRLWSAWTSRVMLMLVVMRAAMMMIVLVAQQIGAEQIDAEADDRDRDRLIEGDGHRRDQTLDALVADQERDHGERDGAGEGGEVAELAGAEGEARVVARSGVNTYRRAPR